MLKEGLSYLSASNIIVTTTSSSFYSRSTRKKKKRKTTMIKNKLVQSVTANKITVHDDVKVCQSKNK